MGLIFDSLNSDLGTTKRGLTYDADGITLIDHYSDELAAYRSRRSWIDVLHSHFLLERDRDYEIWVTPTDDETGYLLSCCFVSACGRYAFWRLINHQAPEAESKLTENAGASKSGVRGFFSGTHKKPRWVDSAVEDQLRSNETNESLLRRILGLFR